MTFTRPLHPICESFSDYRGEPQYQRMVESMRERGFDASCPIVLLRDGRVIDGRHRQSAAAEAGVVPVYTTKDDLNPDDEQSLRQYVMARNFETRAPNAAYRAFWVVKNLLPELRKNAVAKGWNPDAIGSAQRVSLKSIFPDVPGDERSNGSVSWAHIIGWNAGTSHVVGQKVYALVKAGREDLALAIANDELHWDEALYQSGLAKSKTYYQIRSGVRRAPREFTAEQFLAMFLLAYEVSDEVDALEAVYLALRGLLPDLTPKGFVQSAREAVNRKSPEPRFRETLALGGTQ